MLGLVVNSPLTFNGCCKNEVINPPLLFPLSVRELELGVDARRVHMYMCILGVGIAVIIYCSNANNVIQMFFGSWDLNGNFEQNIAFDGAISKWLPSMFAYERERSSNWTHLCAQHMHIQWFMESTSCTQSVNCFRAQRIGATFGCVKGLAVVLSKHTLVLIIALFLTPSFIYCVGHGHSGGVI